MTVFLLKPSNASDSANWEKFCSRRINHGPLHRLSTANHLGPMGIRTTLMKSQEVECMAHPNEELIEMMFCFLRLMH